jgi:hypothetical protein
VLAVKSVPENDTGMRRREADPTHAATAEAEPGMAHSAATHSAMAHASPTMAATTAVPAATTAARNRHVGPRQSGEHRRGGAHDHYPTHGASPSAVM